MNIKLNAKLKYNADGLIPVIVQQHDTNQVLMMAYMNEEALQKTIETGEMHYWSRSRKELWLKGETSGNTQKVVELFTDCDNDTLLAKIEQKGVACHTGELSCFYKKIK